MVKVIEDKCIGCGTCIAMAPDVFELTPDGKAKAKSQSGDGIKESIDACPTQAIVE